MTHAELATSLARMNITVDASEAHGWLAGALCVREGYDAEQWLAELAAGSGDRAPPPDAELRAVAAGTLAAFHSEGFEFAPLLPEDSTPLRERVAALAAWSGGFLYGIGTGASETAVAKAGDAGEFLRDLADIARAELEPGRSAEAGEGDFAQLYEFVRAGAQLAYDEFQALRSHAKG